MKSYQPAGDNTVAVIAHKVDRFIIRKKTAGYERQPKKKTNLH